MTQVWLYLAYAQLSAVSVPRWPGPVHRVTYYVLITHLSPREHALSSCLGDRLTVMTLAQTLLAAEIRGKLGNCSSDGSRGRPMRFPSVRPIYSIFF
ncbi:hypothetical protein F4779DRAFT_591235, partial [Xylariaceae sp. FL0662B]